MKGVQAECLESRLQPARVVSAVYSEYSQDPGGPSIPPAEAGTPNFRVVCLFHQSDYGRRQSSNNFSPRQAFRRLHDVFIAAAG
jgi:hypothetical protein